MRLWYQSLSEETSWPAYYDGLRDHLERSAAGDAEIELHGLPSGIYGDASPIEVQRLPHVFQDVFAPHLASVVVAAESSGYDAVIFGCYSEPWLRESRSRVSIPVLSVFESAVLTGLSLGSLIGLVTTAPEIAYMQRKLVWDAGLSTRVAGHYVIEPPLTEKQLGSSLTEPSAILASFRQASLRAVSDFADVLVPAEGLLNQVVARAGVTEIEGATVVDGIGVAVLDAIRSVRMKERLGIGAGRRWEYPNDQRSLPWDRDSD